MGSVKINQINVNQDSVQFSSSNAQLKCDTTTEKVVITNAFDSTQYLYIGWNQPKPGAGFSIPPGTSFSFERNGSDLDGNALYIGFAGSSGGKAIILEYKQQC